MASHITFPHSASEAFPKDALERIAQTIAEVEKSTNAEIRLSIRNMRDSNEAGMSIEQIALREFAALGMHQTKERSGILLMIIYDERKFYVVGDEGVHKHANPNTWTDVASTLQKHFKHAEFEEGVHEAMRLIQQHVTTLMPPSSDNPNELSDDVVIR